jgi:hypothetical protein
MIKFDGNRHQSRSGVPPDMSPVTGLAALNFFMADVHGGLGPFLATWLASAVH